MSKTSKMDIVPFPVGTGPVYDQNRVDQLGTGYGYTEQPAYPFPRVYHRASAPQQAQRDQELARARRDNWYDYDLIPGAVVHGNVGSPDVVVNSRWALRGEDDARQMYSQEDQFGRDDSDPGEDGIDIYEPLFYYFDRNWPLWASNTEVLNNITRLLSVVTENVTDGDGPFYFRVNLLDPILSFAPATKADQVDTLDCYPPLPRRYPKQPFDAEFRDDDVIGWTQVAHATPFPRLQPYTRHQANFPVTNEMFRRTAEFRNDDLDQAMAEKRVFVVDYKEYKAFNLRPPAEHSAGGRYYTPIAMFAVPRQGGPLKIIAIQSTQDTPRSEAERAAWKDSNEQDPQRPLSDILTPTDDYWSWQMAKTLFMSMYAMSGVVDHLSMHVYIAPVAIGFYRQIPKAHPLRALLEPHLLSLIRNNHFGIFWDTGTQMVFANNGYGRPDQGLLTGMADKISGWTGQTFLDAVVHRAGYYDFVEHSTPLDRSKPNPFSSIEDFPTHDDDGLFPIIEKWVRGYLGHYYRSDEDVRRDHELQAFCNEVAVEGRVAGFPAIISDREELVDLVTRIIYWMSVNHALEATLGCIKLAPVAYWSDRVPRKDESMTEQDWFNVMPPINVALATFCASRFFVDLPREWYRSLGRYPDGNFMHDQRIYEHLKAFQQDLLEFDNHIQSKNITRRWAYGMQRPSGMTCSPWN